MVTPNVHAVCVLHPADDSAACLERVDAAADRQAAAWRVLEAERAIDALDMPEPWEDPAPFIAAYSALAARAGLSPENVSAQLCALGLAA